MKVARMAMTAMTTSSSTNEKALALAVGYA